MVLFLVLCIVVVAVFLMPDAFLALPLGAMDHPEWGIPFLAVFLLIALWIYRR